MNAISRRMTLLSGVALALAACNKGASGAGSAEDMTLGHANAKVKVIEYASLSCVHCAAFNNNVFPAFKAKYIDTGKVHYTFREFLTQPVQVAAAGSLLARCAGEDKYFGVIDQVFHGLEGMAQSGDFRGGLLRIAQSAGMTEAEFDACVSDAEALKALEARVKRNGEKDNITATPTFIINGEKFEGEQSLESLSAAIDPLLK
jgi:protein-disulfide isomerase